MVSGLMLLGSQAGNKSRNLAYHVANNTKDNSATPPTNPSRPVHVHEWTRSAREQARTLNISSFPRVGQRVYGTGPQAISSKSRLCGLNVQDLLTRGISKRELCAAENNNICGGVRQHIAQRGKPVPNSNLYHTEFEVGMNQKKSVSSSSARAPHPTALRTKLLACLQSSHWRSP